MDCDFLLQLGLTFVNFNEFGKLISSFEPVLSDKFALTRKTELTPDFSDTHRAFRCIINTNLWNVPEPAHSPGEDPLNMSLK